MRHVNMSRYDVVPPLIEKYGVRECDVKHGRDELGEQDNH